MKTHNMPSPSSHSGYDLLMVKNEFLLKKMSKIGDVL